MAAEIVREGVGYLPTYLENRAPSTRVTLFVRRYRVTRGPKTRKLRTKVRADAWEFENESAMLEAIERAGAFELPPEADGDPRFVPEDWRT